MVSKLPRLLRWDTKLYFRDYAIATYDYHQHSQYSRNKQRDSIRSHEILTSISSLWSTKNDLDSEQLLLASAI